VHFLGLSLLSFVACRSWQARRNGRVAECMLVQAKIVDIGLVDGFDNADKNAIVGT